MLERARQLTAAEPLDNVRYELGDAQVHRFDPAGFDVAISRFGTMFFSDSAAAFANIAAALRPEARLVLLVWQRYEQNEWAQAIDAAFATPRSHGSRAPTPSRSAMPKPPRASSRAPASTYLWFFGRKKQVIVHDGSNISPYEVEGALVEHPAVALAGAVGVHDEVHGENVRAYVTLSEDTDPPARADLIAYCRERIGYKAPDEIVILDETPLNPTGKIDRVGLKRMAEDHLHPHGLS
jgi:acyl-CoA synthetase (AMP-forming)/AMP-acid ligase II